MPRITDISRTLTKHTAVWPGDTPFRAQQTTFKSKGSNVNTHKFTMSPHVGTHVDASYHVADEGENMQAYDLAIFYGPCAVVEVRGTKQITPADLPDDLPARVLFKTDASYRDENAEWHDEFTSLHPDLPAALTEHDVVLVGTDAASVDQAKSKDLPAHFACFNNKLAIMENLYLANVTPGRYTLSAFPLKCDFLEAAPVRAVLVH